jgi:8-oxo-dGTP pyrophosphatase MutT (NUDIX family)
MSNSVPVPAATVLLVRDNPGLEVLMVERHADIGFAGGASVFPGGRIDPADHDPAWLDMARGLEELDPLERAARVACVREAFEEAGMLIARTASSEPGTGLWASASDCEALAPRRGAVEKDAALFLPLVREAGLRLACDSLQWFARWIPPEGLHKRFDTWFFLAPAPPAQVPLEDGREATALAWIQPQSALDDLTAGRRKIIFPTARNLELLGTSATAQAAFQSASARPREIVQPQMVSRPDGNFLTIPGHLGYPVTEERLDTAMRN